MHPALPATAADGADTYVSIADEHIEQRAVYLDLD